MRQVKQLAQNPWEDLVLSILSVNKYSLERTYSCLEGLRAEGLFDPGNLMRWSTSQIEARLRNASYDRGPFMTNLFAQRLRNLGATVNLKGIDTCTEIISGKNTTAIEALLLPVNGIGQQVMANLCALRGLKR